MTEIDLQLLDNNLRNKIQLLKTISRSSAFSQPEQVELSDLVKGFLGQINNIKLKLGIIGEFNAGKSTLLNAILGKKVVATSDRPCTPVPVYIDGGMTESLTVIQEDGQEVKVGIEEYSRYTTDGEAPAGVKSLRMTVRSTLLLDNRITLIDTPGINAINPLHTQITESVLPEMHAAILLMYSKQPGSKSTLEFLGNAAQQTGKIFVCISKSDFLSSDQLSRIIDGLPDRLSKNSGVDIPKVYPIHFDVSGGGDDFIAFFQELKQFMLTEWYQAISKEIESVLTDYAAKVAHLVKNKLELEERLFFNFMEKAPVDFSSISETLKEKIRTCINKHFNHDQFNSHAHRIGNDCLSRIQVQLEQDLEPNKSVMLFFDKRVNEKTLRKATGNSNVHFKQMAGIQEHVHKITQDFIKTVQDLSVEALASVNSMLDDFRDKVRGEIMARPSIIASAKRARLMRWLGFGVILSAILLGCVFIPQIHAPQQMKLPVYAVAGVLLLIPWLIALNATEKDLIRIAEKELVDMQCFSVPTFVNTHTRNLTIAGIDTNGTFWNKENQNSFNRTGFQVAKVAQTFGGNAAGLEVAAVLGVVNYTLSYFSKPKAKEVYQDLLEQTRAQISNQLSNSSNSFIKHKESIRVAAEQYVSSLPQRYSTVLKEGFDHNMKLLEKRKKTIVELEGFISSLAKA